MRRPAGYRVRPSCAKGWSGERQYTDIFPHRAAWLLTLQAKCCHQQLRPDTQCSFGLWVHDLRLVAVLRMLGQKGACYPFLTFCRSPVKYA